MNKRIDFTYNGGFPATQYMTDYMQTSYRAAFMALAGLIGDKVIVTGCQIVGDQITNGWISVNGELVPFVGGTGNSASTIAIVETNESRLFQDNNSHAVYFLRQAQISSPGSFLFSDLKQPGLVPTGLISMWSGAINAIPLGWALCDGTNGTPNLSGKFIVGYADGDADYYAIGNTGGENKHTLTIAEMPSHDHPEKVYTAVGTGGRKPVGFSDTLSDFGNSGVNTGATGGGAAHENRPPYYTLAYIIKQ